MLCNYCAIVIIISFLVKCGISPSVSQRDTADLDEYANDVGGLLVDLPLLNRTSTEKLYKEKDDFESFSENASTPFDERSYSDNLAPEDVSLNNISGQVVETSESSASPEEHRRDIPSFSIDAGIDSSPTKSRSPGCLFDQRHITEMFKECIHIQAKSTAPDPPSNVSVTSSTRDYDARFLKYCRKAPQLRGCVKNMIVNRLDHCLDEGVRETVNNVEEITERIIKFVCINEADRISIFISDGGLDCLLSSNWRMHMCLSVHLGSYVLISILGLTSLHLQNVKCINLQSAQRCVAQELEMCDDPTTAIVAKLMFDIVMEITSCQNIPEEKGTTISTEPLQLLSLPSSSDGEHTTEGIGNINESVAEFNMSSSVNRYGGRAEHLTSFCPMLYTTLLPSDQDNVDQNSKVSPILNAFSIASGQGDISQHSTVSPILNASSVADIQGDTDTKSTASPILNEPSVVSNQGDIGQKSTASPILDESSVVSNQGDLDQKSTVGPIHDATSAAFDKDQPSAISPELEATPKSPIHVVNATISSQNNSATTKSSLLCTLLILSLIIIVIL